MVFHPCGNWPAGYMYTPNTGQLDQAVMYVERLPDTVQKDHIDWGFRVAGLYGENYRYTVAYGLASYQLLTGRRSVAEAVAARPASRSRMRSSEGRAFPLMASVGARARRR